jgi:hypothetical protein
MKKVLVIGLVLILALALSAAVYGRYSYFVRVQPVAASVLFQAYPGEDPTVDDGESETPGSTGPATDYDEPYLKKPDESIESGYTGGGGGPNAACW